MKGREHRGRVERKRMKGRMIELGYFSDPLSYSNHYQYMQNSNRILLTSTAHQIEHSLFLLEKELNSRNRLKHNKKAW